MKEWKKLKKKKYNVNEKQRQAYKYIFKKYLFLGAHLLEFNMMHFLPLVHLLFYLIWCEIKHKQLYFIKKI